ncbi:MAG TPA: NAD(P)(+) transhydrogenase (Re/Si-specific) subunit beta [Vicinamibacterales bacterium]|nr:NAD(P)(+) transhydrogenase (Re/Si-specific) subunit beta [Vicinamibacterales bacterium]
MMIAAVHPAISLAWLAASILFILSLRGLSSQTSARQGNLWGVIGMALAVAATLAALVMGNGLVGVSGSSLALLTIVIAIGCAVGAMLAARVAMTAMPELVAVLHSFVGLAAVLVGFANYLAPSGRTGGELAELGTASAAVAGHGVHLAEIYIGVLVGAVTFTGSIIAFFKLRGSIGSRPLLLPARHALNAAVVAAMIVLAVMFVRADGVNGLVPLAIMTALAGLLGIHLVMAIGGGDMPVVVSLLNSYSGWAASAAGFMLSNDLLIITGALVGSSGAILSFIMCNAMNRSIWNVVFGGFGADAGAKPSDAASVTGKITEATVEQVADLLRASRSVIVVPGYGMAVARAQHAVRDLTNELAKRGVKTRYAIHPVAGRLPGHMNVLLAEADVPYDIVHEMEEINGDFPATDAVLVIGANDIVNPSAQTDTGSPIYGMPVLEAWKAGKVVMLKRGMSAGYAGVDNPLCYEDNTLMLFGDAQATVTKLLTALRT